MQNIDPLYFLTPVAVIAFSFLLVAYLWTRRRFTWWTLAASLVAYGGALATKAAVQAVTYQPFDGLVGGDLSALGAYFGLQTVLFEVGGAFLVARYAVKRGKLAAGDATGYGVGLALWENGVLVGGGLLLTYTVYYLTLGSGGGVADQLLADLLGSSPALFYGASSALPLIGYAVLERVSSLIAHFSWGYLAVMAAYLGRGRYLLLALPMGLIDFVVPFSGSVGPGASEGLLFGLGVACVAVAMVGTRRERSTARTTGARPPVESSMAFLVKTTIRRSISFGRIYLGMGVLLPLVAILPLTQVSPATGEVPALLSQLPALILPMFVVIGSIGGLLVFTSDRNKGVYEYMIAYGLDTSSIFWSTIAATLCLVSIPLAFGVTEAVVAQALGGGVSAGTVELLVFYTVPLSYAASAFMCAAGMVFSALTAQMAGVNSPVGVAPLLGFAPSMLVLLVATGVGGDLFVYVVGVALVVLVLASVLMVYVGSRKMVRERFLSNA